MSGLGCLAVRNTVDCPVISAGLSCFCMKKGLMHEAKPLTKSVVVFSLVGHKVANLYLENLA
jgi:hypothetical protein